MTSTDCNVAMDFPPGRAGFANETDDHRGHEAVTDAELDRARLDTVVTIRPFLELHARSPRSSPTVALTLTAIQPFVCALAH